MNFDFRSFFLSVEKKDLKKKKRVQYGSRELF